MLATEEIKVNTIIDKLDQSPVSPSGTKDANDANIGDTTDRSLHSSNTNDNNNNIKTLQMPTDEHNNNNYDEDRFSNDEDRTLFVGDLPTDYTASHLSQIFNVSTHSFLPLYLCRYYNNIYSNN